MEDSVAFQKSLPYQFRQLLHELNAVATPGGQGVDRSDPKSIEHARLKLAEAVLVVTGDDAVILNR